MNEYERVEFRRRMRIAEEMVEQPKYAPGKLPEGMAGKLLKYYIPEMNAEEYMPEQHWDKK